MALFLAGLGTVFAGLRGQRWLTAFLGSCAFITGILAATAACLWPVMLRSTLDPRFSLDALNYGSGAYGMRAGMVWWVVALILVVGYFTMVFRYHRGKVQVQPEGY